MLHKDHTIAEASLIMLRNKENKIFLQLRAKDDDSYGGCWDATAGGGVEAGETPDQAAHRELQEEIGVSADVQFIAKELFVFSEEDKEWMYIYTGQYDGEFIPDKKEVERVEAFSVEQLREMIKDESQFHPEGLYVLKKYFLKDV